MSLRYSTLDPRDDATDAEQAASELSRAQAALEVLAAEHAALAARIRDAVNLPGWVWEALNEREPAALVAVYDEAHSFEETIEDAIEALGDLLAAAEPREPDHDGEDNR